MVPKCEVRDLWVDVSDISEDRGGPVSLGGVGVSFGVVGGCRGGLASGDSGSGSLGHCWWRTGWVGESRMGYRGRCRRWVRSHDSGFKVSDLGGEDGQFHNKGWVVVSGRNECGLSSNAF